MSDFDSMEVENAAVVKETGLEVRAVIQGEKVRVSGKKRDDLQTCVQALPGRSQALRSSSMTWWSEA